MPGRILRMGAALFLAVLTSGCGNGWLAGGDAPEWSAPLVIPDSALRCPDVDPAARREFSRTTSPLKPDTADANGAPAVSDAATKRKFDDFRTREAAKNSAGKRLLEDYERCRTGAAPATS